MVKRTVEPMAEDERSRCDNCSKEYAVDGLKEIDDLVQRVHPGGIMPSGQCPDEACGALCYPLWTFADADDDTVSCPVGDPSCTSGDDESHDACEAPESAGAKAERILADMGRDFSTAYAGHADLDVSLKMNPKARSHDDGPVTEDDADKAYYTIARVRDDETVVGNFRADGFYQRIRQALEEFATARPRAEPLAAYPFPPVTGWTNCGRCRKPYIIPERAGEPSLHECPDGVMLPIHRPPAKPERPIVVWSDYFGDWVISTRIVSPTEWYFARHRSIRPLESKARTSLNEMLRGR